jgi:hypothetical protein
MNIVACDDSFILSRPEQALQAKVLHLPPSKVMLNLDFQSEGAVGIVFAVEAVHRVDTFKVLPYCKTINVLKKKAAR